MIDEIRRALTDDLGSPGALALIDDWADRTLAGNGSDPAAGAAMAAAVDSLLGVEL